MEVGKIISLLADRPLSKDQKIYFVDREKDLSSIINLVKYQPFGIFGVCGETGIGKTTLFNFVDSDNCMKIEVSIVHRETKESILYDLLYRLSSVLKGSKASDIKKLSGETLKWLVEEVSVLKGASLNAMFGGKIEQHKVPRFNIFAAEEKLHDLLRKSIEIHGKVLLIVDELDKEKKEDVLNVLDSLKLELQQDGLISIFSMPYSIYREYRNDRMKWNESGNLENIIKDIVFLEEMPDSDIKELLIRRLGNLATWFEEDALESITLFADGNPRDALWIAQKVAFDNIYSERVAKKNCEESILKIVKEYMSDLSLTQIQRQVLAALKNFTGSKEEILKILSQNSIKRTTAYSTIERLLMLGMIIERRGIYRLSGKAQIYISSMLSRN